MSSQNSQEVIDNLEEVLEAARHKRYFITSGNFREQDPGPAFAAAKRLLRTEGEQESV